MRVVGTISSPHFPSLSCSVAIQRRGILRNLTAPPCHRPRDEDDVDDDNDGDDDDDGAKIFFKIKISSLR